MSVRTETEKYGTRTRPSGRSDRVLVLIFIKDSIRGEPGGVVSRMLSLKKLSTGLYKMIDVRS